MTQSSGIELPEQICIPSPWLVNALLEIVEVVGSVVQYFGDDEGTFPHRGELMGPLLIHSKHQITFVKRLALDMPCMEATQVLLIHSRPDQSHLSLFLKEINAILPCLLSFILRI